MPVGTQKDYYAVLGVSRGAKPEEIRKAYRHLARNSKASINFSPVRHSVKCDDSGFVVYPQKNPVVTDTVLVDACEVGRGIPKGP